MASAIETKTAMDSSEERKAENEVYRLEIVPSRALFFLFLHLGGISGLYIAFTSASRMSVIFGSLYSSISGIGVTAGLHRLWAHRSYKARWPLRLFLAISSSMANQLSIYVWARDHRMHHKYSETNADPYSIKRGFFFAHIGWLLCKKHPEVIRKGRTLSFDDLLADPIVRFQHRFYWIISTFMCYVVPTIVPPLLWDESNWNSFFYCALFGHFLVLHITFLVNSVAHKFGNRPYEKRIEARENPFVAFCAMGEGWHNYHHAFPSDYATSELGYTLNITKLFIDAMAALGLAYDLKSTPKDLILRKKMKSSYTTMSEME